MPPPLPPIELPSRWPDTSGRGAQGKSDRAKTVLLVAATQTTPSGGQRSPPAPRWSVRWPTITGEVAVWRAGKEPGIGALPVLAARRSSTGPPGTAAVIDRAGQRPAAGGGQAAANMDAAGLVERDGATGSPALLGAAVWPRLRLAPELAPDPTGRRGTAGNGRPGRCAENGGNSDDTGRPGTSRYGSW
jgi:hypothetical protein